jgi:hypothetical protein
LKVVVAYIKSDATDKELVTIWAVKLKLVLSPVMSAPSFAGNNPPTSWWQCSILSRLQRPVTTPIEHIN